jgi:hypothetical protein
MGDVSQFSSFIFFYLKMTTIKTTIRKSNPAGRSFTRSGLRKQDNDKDTYGTFSYTDKELYVKSKTYSEAIEIAKMILKEKKHRDEINLTSLEGVDQTKLLTIKELNDVVDVIVRQSLYH